MSLIIAHDQLLELLHDFHNLTGIRIVIFDDNFKEILTYPEQPSELCKFVRKDMERLRSCELSNRNSFEKCKQCGNLVIYKCHAGLIEATAPIMNNGVIIGFIMFGQITDGKDRDALAQSMKSHFDIPDNEFRNWLEAAHKIKYKNFTQIKSASKILEACTYYVLKKELVSLKHERLVDKINHYIEENLNRDIKVSELAAKFHICRTRLYEITNEYLGMGLAEYIRKKKLERAKCLLLSTTDSISNVALQIGIDDYTYFSKMFKNEYNMSPKKFRQKYNQL